VNVLHFTIKDTTEASAVIQGVEAVLAQVSGYFLKRASDVPQMFPKWSLNGASKHCLELDPSLSCGTVPEAVNVP
jgi:hypothetical protein